MNIHPSIIGDLAVIPFAENILRRFYNDATLIKWFMDEIWDYRESEDFPGYRDITEEDWGAGLHESLWKDIPGWPGYQAHYNGRIRGPHGKTHERRVNKHGYEITVLHRDGKRKNFPVHKLVAMAFHDHEPCGYKEVIHHKNHDRTINAAWNLEPMDAHEHWLLHQE